MRIALALFAALALALCGCISRSRARTEAQAAFAAGQDQAIARIQDARRINILVRGNVRHPEVQWIEGLTLAQVIVAADYTGVADPTDIIVSRQREQFHVNPRELLNGKNWPLEPGDTVEIR